MLTFKQLHTHKPNSNEHKHKTQKITDKTTVACERVWQDCTWIREAVNIWQESQGVTNRDEGTTSQLSHIYDNSMFSVVMLCGERKSIQQRQQLLPKSHLI